MNLRLAQLVFGLSPGAEVEFGAAIGDAEHQVPSAQTLAVFNFSKLDTFVLQ
jgi:hypothetical protein